MSKFYKCDCCGKIESTKNGFLEFSCKDHSLTITNRCSNAKGSVQFGNWSKIHFCSQKCFNETFFNDIEKELLISILQKEMAKKCYQNNKAYVEEQFSKCLKLIENSDSFIS